MIDIYLEKFHPTGILATKPKILPGHYAMSKQTKPCHQRCGFLRRKLIWWTEIHRGQGQWVLFVPPVPPSPFLVVLAIASVIDLISP
jgi:hypothetical protein